MGFGSPSTPPPPPAPVIIAPPVKGNEPEINEARIRSRSRQKKLGIRKQTLLTSPQGLPSLLHTENKTSKALGD